jgi:hypothetical protein
MNKSPHSALAKAAAHSCQIYNDAYNSNDPEALANLFTDDATLVTDTGIYNGREAILRHQIEVFKIIKITNHQGAADPTSIYPLGTDGKKFFAPGAWSQTTQMEDQKPILMNGFWSAIILNDGSGQDLMQTWNIAPGQSGQSMK